MPTEGAVLMNAESYKVIYTKIIKSNKFIIFGILKKATHDTQINR